MQKPTESLGLRIVLVKDLDGFGGYLAGSGKSGEEPVVDAMLAGIEGGVGGVDADRAMSRTEEGPLERVGGADGAERTEERGVVGHDAGGCP